MQDAVTKYPEAVPLHRMTAEDIAKAIMEVLVVHYGSGLTIITDRGSQFTSDPLKSACKKLGIVKLEVLSFNPQANPIERFYRTIEAII